MSDPIRLGLVGLGKIARDQHLPAIAGNGDFALVATASRNASASGLPSYAHIDAMLAAEPDIDAVVLCQPPQVRFEAARAAILAGKHVFLEKPPGTSLGEIDALVQMATYNQVCLFASWHSRYAAAVMAARSWFDREDVSRVTIEWKEDVRQWHPGQPWIWEPGGFGVFDPGINALSILTALVPEPIRVLAARLEVPDNRSAPIAAVLDMASSRDVAISATFDWRQVGEQSWNIDAQAGASHLRLSDGGNQLRIDGQAHPVEAEAEYPAMYAHFAHLVRARKSDVDVRPLKIVADAFLCAETLPTIAFHD